MPRCYSYVRFSSKKQEQGDSIRRQVEKRNAWIANHQGCFLDTEINLEDLGISAATGDNLDPRKGNLGKFVEICRSGKIERGSYLIFERLDRFSRKAVLKVTSLLDELVSDHGLKIVVLDPSEQIIDDSNIGNTDVVLSVVLQLQMAFEQSREKAYRVGQAWVRKRQLAQSGQVATKKCPAWLHWSEKQKGFEVNEKAGEAIKFIFDQAASGVGQVKIVRHLNNRFTPISKPTAKSPVRQWNTSYVNKILHDKSVLGIYQPMRFDEKKNRVPAGDPIKDYYPRVISDDLFHRARYSQSHNRKANATTKTNFVNILSGIVKCVSDGNSMQIQTSRQKRKNGEKYVQRRLVSYGHKRNDKSCPFSIEYFAFESLVIAAMKEIRKEDILDTFEPSSEAADLEKTISGARRHIEEIDKKIKDHKFLSILDDLLQAKMDATKKLEEYAERLTRLRGLQPRTRADIAKDIRELTGKGTAKRLSPKEIRSRFSQVIPTIIDRVEVCPCKFSNRSVGAAGCIVLRSGHRRAIAFKKNANKQHFTLYDKDKLPVLQQTSHGWVFFERTFDGRDRMPDEKIEVASVRWSGSKERPPSLAKTMKAVRELYDEAKFWNGIRPKLIGFRLLNRGKQSESLSGESVP
jgi:DNA invertase Pin-like site-specific DNA recombinase